MSNAPVVAYGLESPYPLQPAAGYVRLEGWALIVDAGARTRTRLIVGDTVYAPAAESTRADVAAQYPGNAHAADCGFEFLCYLPFGNHPARLEASCNGKDWLPVLSFIAPVAPRPLMGDWVPPAQSGSLVDPERIQGWCLLPDFEIATVVLQFGDVDIPCDYGVSRPDVGAQFPDHSQSARCGFITRENLPRGRGRLKLKVTTRCGRVYFMGSEFEGEIRNGAYAQPRAPRDMWDDASVDWLRRAKNHPAPTRASTAADSGGGLNVLFVLYGDFTSNSAAHVTAFANGLIARGYDCIVAVPEHMETIGAQPRARFLTIEFDEFEQLPALYRDGHGPSLVHAWTTRENVRCLTEAVAARFGAPFFIHLEDNEYEIVARHFDITAKDVSTLIDAFAERTVPPNLTHPANAQAFLGQAAGITTIVDQLQEFVPDGVPARTIWPAADDSSFYARPRNETLRAALGIPTEDTVVCYHGNVHTANAVEVGELYEAVALLNAEGQSTWLIRTGRSPQNFANAYTTRLRDQLIELGYVKRAADLPELLAMADVFVQPGLPGRFNDYRFPSKLPEFFALGRPVILPASNLGCSVRHREHAFVLPSATARTIADAVIAIRSDPRLAQSLSQGALDYAREHFSWATSTGHLMEFYRQHSDLSIPDEATVAAAAALFP